MHITPNWSLAPAFVSLALVGGIFGLGSGVSAQDSPARTLTFRTLEKGSTFSHVRNTTPKSRRANVTGDVIVFTNPLADVSGKVVGKLYVDCTTTMGAADFRKSTITCVGVVTVLEGTLTLQANSSPGVRTTTGAVTGGTGPYAAARGTFVASDSTGEFSITLAG